MSSRLLSSLVVATLLGTTVSLVSMSPAAAAPPTLRVSIAAPISGEIVTFSGGLGVSQVRPVLLQRRVGERWVTTLRRASAATGRFVLRRAVVGTAGTSQRFRVFAPRAVVAGKARKAIATPTRTLVLRAQTAALAAPASATSGIPFNVTGSFTPVRVGRTVIAQQFVAGTWVERKRGVQNSAGKVTLSLTVAAPATALLRVVAVAFNGAPVKASAARAVTVKAPIPVLDRASQTAAGVEADGASAWPALSADGRFAVFSSTATNLVPGDTNGFADIFVHDNTTGVVERVSIASDGTQATADSVRPRVSADGRYVVFDSTASNLDPSVSSVSQLRDVFKHDRQTGTTTQISRLSNDLQPNSDSFDASISADGDRVVFTSFSSNLGPGSSNNAADIFLHDASTGAITVVSLDTAGGLTDGSSGDPEISGDGNWVALSSNASDLVTGDSNAKSDVFLRDLGAGTTVRVSEGPANLQADDFSAGPSLSHDGSVVAFYSRAKNLTGQGHPNADNVFVWTKSTEVVEFATFNAAGTPIGTDGYNPTISGDGRYVAYASGYDNFGADSNGSSDVFVRDRTAGTSQRISLNLAGEQPNGDSTQPAISADGRFVAYVSLAANLAADDTNSVADIYVRDLSR